MASVISIALLMGAPSAFQHTSLNVFAISAYESGFNHGITDGEDSCTQPSGCNWYILELGKGFAFHSKDFVKGYVNGFCTIDPKASSDADQATFDCARGPDSASWVTEK